MASHPRKPRQGHGRRLERRLTGIVFWLAVTLTLPAIAAGEDICGYAPQGMVTVSRDGYPVASFRVGLAENKAHYRQGLMHCTALAPGKGLLFVYPAPARRIFWMKDTPLGLAILFADADGRIQAIEEGKPYSTRRIHSPSDIQYVLEINFSEAGPLQIGDRIDLRLLPE